MPWKQAGLQYGLAEQIRVWGVQGLGCVWSDNMSRTPHGPDNYEHQQRLQQQQEAYRLSQ